MITVEEDRICEISELRTTIAANWLVVGLYLILGVVSLFVLALKANLVILTVGMAIVYLVLTILAARSIDRVDLARERLRAIKDSEQLFVRFTKR